MARILDALLFLQTEPPGRGGDLEGAGGIVLIVGIALAVLLIALGAGFVAMRGYRRRREAAREGEAVRHETASEQGRPFSSER